MYERQEKRKAVMEKERLDKLAVEQLVAEKLAALTPTVAK